MPFYDYKCHCGNEQEEFHNISSEQVIKCNKCNSTMEKVIKLGSGGFKMIKDGTRGRDYKTRYGGKVKKSDNTLTPTESAQVKANAQREERLSKKKDINDPYAGLY